MGLRKALELYANLRPVKSVEGIKSRWEGVDLVIVRENREDLYAGLEHTVVPGVVESLKIITEKPPRELPRSRWSTRGATGGTESMPFTRPTSWKLSDGLFLTSTRKSPPTIPRSNARR